MRNFLLIFIFLATKIVGQTESQFVIPTESMLSKLLSGDSLVYYQCHVEEAIQQLSTASGQTLTTASQKYSITEKYVVKREGQEYKATYYISSLNILPNRKFSGLKIREKAYWNFKKEKEVTLTELQLKAMVALEKKGREANEYDFAISKHTTNQLIIRQRKDFKQLVINGNYILSKTLLN